MNEFLVYCFILLLLILFWINEKYVKGAFWTKEEKQSFRERMECEQKQ